MPSTSQLRSLLLSALIATLTACGSLQGPEVGPRNSPLASDYPGKASTDNTSPVTSAGADTTLPQESSSLPPPPSSNAAVVALLDTAQADASAGRLPSASASIERALRIEPRNPQLWHELARIKLQKGDYPQAENFAARSNSWAGSNKALQAKNWRLISEARTLRGDSSGAKSALARAKALEQATD